MLGLQRHSQHPHANQEAAGAECPYTNSIQGPAPVDHEQSCSKRGHFKPLHETRQGFTKKTELGAPLPLQTHSVATNTQWQVAPLESLKILDSLQLFPSRHSPARVAWKGSSLASSHESQTPAEPQPCRRRPCPDRPRRDAGRCPSRSQPERHIQPDLQRRSKFQPSAGSVIFCDGQCGDVGHD